MVAMIRLISRKEDKKASNDDRDNADAKALDYQEDNTDSKRVIPSTTITVLEKVFMKGMITKVLGITTVLIKIRLAADRTAISKTTRRMRSILLIRLKNSKTAF